MTAFRRQALQTSKDPHRPQALRAAIGNSLTFNGTVIETGTDSYHLAATQAQAKRAAG